MCSQQNIYVASAIIAALVTILQPFPAFSDAANVLVQNGVSASQIALQEGASPSEKHAAEEFQYFFKACTGVTLPIQEVTGVTETPMILLGCGPVARELGVAPDKEALGEQGYYMKTVVPHLVIAGTPEAGTLYGVYDFLENRLGVRWYATDETKTPETDTLALPQEDGLRKPVIQWRHTSYAWPGRDETFQARVRENHGEGGADHPYGIQH
ncbi:MAG TPA: alpha-glucuronidase family glycosyl hydrolase, partial [Candidatus Hydrogenedentes bacterium]|nr:alpha-glucuronidase family glycosyl hydrolase [Candidatus Hydrogenedentota bacterium]